MDSNNTKSRAPGALSIVQAFVNTLDVETGKDALGDVEQLRAWATDRDLAGHEDVAALVDLERAKQLRESLRALLEANNGATVDAQAVATLNEIAERAGLRVKVDERGGSHLESCAAGINGVFGRLLAIVYTSMADGTWDRLKACRCETCRWAFYDISKNHSGTWCTMAVCGSRVKARTYRKRRQAAS
jgi:predicted RNA-binding Zn ribbon-like protein